ncbi:MAG: hypothetical protein M0Q38_03480 [Bacteroidales bacterium]|jgi:hypothetical protein|nr:hypothetical protein [Bacteroidales bacterium]
MNKKIIKDELQWLLEAINEQYETIKTYEDKIPRIEFDILMDNVRKFYEDMRMLQRTDQNLPQAERKTKAPAIENQTTTEQPHSKPMASMPSNQNSSPEITVRFEKPTTTTDTPPLPHPPAREAPRRDIPSTGRKLASTGEADLFAAEEPVFSIKLKEARENTLGPKSASTRIDNLKNAITINEKFMFINELFEGNLRDYNETIETLNGFKDFNQASEYLDLMVKKNFWNTGLNAFKKLKELVERRF